MSLRHTFKYRLRGPETPRLGKISNRPRLFWKSRRLLVAVLLSGATALFGSHIVDRYCWAPPSIFRYDEKDLITFWYGLVQKFGRHGNPQRWINVLGNIRHSVAPSRSYYWLNGNIKQMQRLKLGCDKHRLALPGDFNVQLDGNDLWEGRDNILTVATTVGKTTWIRNVTLIVEKSNKWQLPYWVDFSNADDDNFQNVVQVVDGHWAFHRSNISDPPRGLRTLHRYYDRFLTVGDNDWTDYSVAVQLVVHDYTPPAIGPPTYDCTHISIGLRWRGHAIDQFQPHRKTYPVGSFGEFMLRRNHHQATIGTWRIVFGAHAKHDKKAILKSNASTPVLVGEPIWIKGQAITMPEGKSTMYSFKQWAGNEMEPEDWDLVGVEDMEGDYPSGAVAFAMHHTDVTILSFNVVQVTQY